ncbi:MAG: AAA family ATPase [Candidatus Sungbacteria bacterium]|nr:AAA family ATPase [Candidatus Sungbacteria bacterium]
MASTLSKKRRDFIFKESTKFTPVKREEIHGADKLLTVFDFLIVQLKNFKELERNGAEITRGAILYGPSGTGKTFFSRYLATESSACFVDMRKFPRPIIQKRTDMLAPDDITEIYRLAKEYVKKNRKPVILFFDELREDADEDLLEQLRMEIDGINSQTNGILLVITTTAGDPEEIDEGLFRDKRVSLQIPFLPPTPKGREELLKYYLSKVSSVEGIDISSINYLFSDYTTPASISQFVSDAYAKACSETQKGEKEKPLITEDHLIEAILPRLAGFFTEESLSDKKSVAIHESGHAYLAKKTGLPVQVVTIYPAIIKKTFSLGMTITMPNEDKQEMIKDLKNSLMVSCGGYLAEKICGYAENTGLRGDLNILTFEARFLVEQLGQGRNLRESYGPIQIMQKEKVSEEILKLIDRDVGELVKEAENTATQILKDGIHVVKRIAERLFQKKLILQRELNELMIEK